MGHQGPCSLPGPRAVEDADVEQVLENDVKRRNEIAYDFVGDVVRATGFPCVNLPEYVSHFVETDSVRMDIWVKGYDLLFSLALTMGWSNACLYLLVENVVLDFIGKDPFQLGRECLQFLCRSH